MKADFQTNFHGKVPFGFIGGVGYRFKVADHITLFVEGEYLNINVPRKKSKLDSFSATRTVGGVTTPLTIEEFRGYMDIVKNLPSNANTERLVLLANQISPLLEEEYDWDGKGAPDAPYSSFGVHFGVTYIIRKTKCTKSQNEMYINFRVQRYKKKPLQCDIVAAFLMAKLKLYFYGVISCEYL